MAVLSVLRGATQRLGGVSFTNFLAKTPSSSTACVRYMSDKRVMQISPSRFQWNKFKDALHFYTLLGAIPLLSLVFYANVFIGPAELAEIPEGYEPKTWEYYRHPIQQWFARYVYPSHQQEYEKAMHFLRDEWEQIELRKIEDQVRDLMAERGDYQAWYYTPITAKYHRKHRRETDDIREHLGE